MNKNDVSIHEICYQNPHLLETERVLAKYPKTGIFICKEGEIKLKIDDKEYLLHKNSMIVFFANSILHVMECSKNLSGVMIGADLAALQPVLYNVTNFNALFELLQSPLQQVLDEELEVMTQYICLLKAAIKRDMSQKELETSNSPFGKMASRQVSLLCSSLVIEILQCYTCTAECCKPMSRKEDVLQHFLTLLYKHYREEHKISYYASRLYLTPRYFSLVIKEQSGQSPLNWITTALFVDARNMLQDTNYSIKEIADTLHFPTQSYFGKWFKNLTGLNPLEYRHNKAAVKNQENELNSFIEKHLNSNTK